MKRITRIALASAAIVAVGGVVAATAQADGRWQGGEGYHKEGGKHGGSKGGRGGMMKMFSSFDTNGDGALTQDEIDGARVARFTAYDANGDRILTLDEYQAMWLDAARGRMVDGFQRLDADGDGEVTAAEFEAPFATMVANADRNEDGRLDKDDRPRRGMHGHDDYDDDDDDDEDDS